MSKIWKSYELGKISTIYNGNTPSTKNIEFWDGNIIWITPKDLSDQNKKYISRGERTITKKALSKTKLLPKGTILLSSRAPIGLVSISNTELVTNQGFKNIVVNQSILSNEFLYYHLKLRKLDLYRLGSGTTFKELSKSSLESIIIRFPDLPTQKSIAKILSDIDAKIELNNRINAQLEAMAKLIYDYWFVQFNFPYKKAGTEALEGPYKSSGGKMVWNKELKREIPEGWEVKRLGNILHTSLGGTPPTSELKFWDGGTMPWLNSGEISKFPIIDSEVKITKEAVKASATTMLPKGSVLLSITRHLRPSILAIDACANQSVVGIREREEIKCNFIYPYLKNEIPRLITLRSGAQQPHINKEIVDQSLIIMPNRNSYVLKLYNSKVEPVYTTIINNAFENQHLTSLRDWLLPMLMNGQVNVHENKQASPAMAADEAGRYRTAKNDTNLKSK